jgi:carbamoyl-phosphate synthase large subunit
MRLTIAVSGINAVDNPGPGTGIIRALRESGLAREVDLRIIGLAYDAMEPGVYMTDLIDKSYLMPYPSAGRESFLKRIAAIHEDEELAVIISALDAELPLYMDLEKTLSDQFNIAMLIPNRQAYTLRDKTRLKELAEMIDVKVPEYAVCTSLGDLEAAIAQLGCPCMVKGPFYEAFKALNPNDAETYFHKLVNKWGYPVIVQSFIKGDEFNVVGCGDGTGNDLGLFAMRKMTVTNLGKVWNAVSIDNPKLIQAASNLVSHLAWRGGFELETMIDAATGDIHLIEVNPRFPAWTYMAAAAGINLPERMVRFLTHRPYERHSNYASGKLMIRYTSEMLRDIADFEKISTTGAL